MALPSVCIVTAAAREDANRVWDAMGRGPNTFSRKCCAIDPGATYETPATHYLMADSSSEEADVAMWQEMANGDLPEIEGVWGENGVIDAPSAMAATSASNLHVYSVSGDVTPQAHVAACLATEGLQLVPDEPL